MKKLLSLILTTVMAMSLFSSVVLADETEAPEAEVATTETTEQSQETIDLSGKTFENVYGSQLYSFLNHKYTFQGVEIPVEEVNFYFINTFLDLCNYAYYGYYPSTGEGYLDLAAPMEENEYGYKTYADMFVKYAEQSLATNYVICAKAKLENITLSDEAYKSMDDMFKDLDENGAKLANMELDEYIKLYYGPTCDEAAFRQILEHYYLADLYTSKYCENFNFTDEQKVVPNIRYALFYAPSGSSDEQVKAAENLAKELLGNSKDLDALKTEAEKAQTEGFVYETNDIPVTKGSTVPAFDTWSWDASRKEGDIDMIFSEEYGYFVVGYLGKTEVDKETLNEIAATKLSEDILASIKSGEYVLKTDDKFSPAVTVAPTPTSMEQDNPSITLTPMDPTEETGNSNNNTPAYSVKEIVIIILAAVGGVALIALIVILVVYFVRKTGKKENDEIKSLANELAEEKEDIKDEE